MASQGDKHNRFGFRVHPEANKIQIKEEVEKIYGVTVEKVATMIVPGKKRVKFTKTGFQNGMKSSYKKAYVTLAEGETIDFYSNI